MKKLAMIFTKQRLVDLIGKYGKDAKLKNIIEEEQG